jgi:restriction endonuclease S subunit
LIDKKNYDYLENIISDIVHPTEVLREYSEKGIQILLAQNVRNNSFDFSNELYMNETKRTFLERNLICYDDIPLTRSGANYGQMACFKYKNKEIFACADLLLIKSSNNIKGGYLSTFFNTKYGRALLDRGAYGMAQPHIAPMYLKRLKIIRLENLETEIDNLVIKNIELTEQSQSIYRQAEELLLETIGLKGFQSSRENKNIKNLSESFLATGRLDAEYYQPKYEEIILQIKQQKYDLLGNLVSIKKSIEPGSNVYSDEGLPFLRVADYNKFGISSPEKKLSDSFCRGNQGLIERLKPKKETILFSKDGSVGTAYMLREDANFITSGAILHLTVKNKKVLPEYLALALNSKAVQQQAERDSGGSIILHWRMDEIEKVVLPIVDIKIQQKIATLIKKSFALRAESERLLDEAKEMVEREIEKG